MRVHDFRIDIVINNHNYGRYVLDALSSARAQDHPNVTVTVVDDGSTDDSRERLRRHASGVEVILKDNEGQASAVNAALQRVSGDGVIFLDADDVLEPQAASRVARAFVEHPDASRVYYRMGVIDAGGHSRGTTKPPPHQPMRSGDLRVATLTSPFDMPWSPMSGNAFRTAALRRIMPIPVAYGRWGADWYLVHLSNLLGAVVHISEVCAQYREHGDNAHQPRHAALDLDHVRRTLTYEQLTRDQLTRLGAELQCTFHQPILSVSELAHRVILRRLAPDSAGPGAEPLPRLMVDTWRAAARRYDTPAAMKAALVLWVWAIACLPRPVARVFAEWLLFPERRRRLSGAIGRLQSTRSSRPQ